MKIKRNNVFFFLIIIFILDNAKKIIMKLAKITPTQYVMSYNTIFPNVVIIIIPMILVISCYKNQFIRYCFSLIFIVGCLEYLPRILQISISPNEEIIIGIIALILLTFTLVLAIKYRTVEDSRFKPIYIERRSILITIMVIIFCAIIFIWYGRP